MVRIATLLLLVLLPLSVFAHHPMDYATPSNFFEGLLSGFGHPIIGIDHFAFVVGVGLLAARRGRFCTIPLAFVATTLLGTGLHLLALNLPAAEAVISLSVLLLGAVLLLPVKLPTALLFSAIALAGLFHGYAYGEAVVGAETTPLLAYLLGFGFIQSVIALGTALGASLLTAKRWQVVEKQVAPAGLTLTGVLLVGGQLVGA